MVWIPRWRGTPPWICTPPWARLNDAWSLVRHVPLSFQRCPLYSILIRNQNEPEEVQSTARQRRPSCVLVAVAADESGREKKHYRPLDPRQQLQLNLVYPFVLLKQSRWSVDGWFRLDSWHVVSSTVDQRSTPHTESGRLGSNLDHTTYIPRYPFTVVN
jgi:hypothetical protein